MAGPALPPDEIDKIQRMFYDENLSKTEIAHRTGYNRETVRKYIPVKAEQGTQRCSNAELAKKQIKPKGKPKKTQPDTPLGAAFAAPKTSNNLKVPALLDPIEYNTSPVKLDVPGNWLILSDVHFPFHDRRALELAIERAQRDGIVGIVLNGDIIDGLGLSSKFHKKPTDHMFEQELEHWEAFIQWLRHHFPKVKIVYKRGNHEERFETYLAKFPEFFGLKHVQFQNVMEFAKYGVQEVKDGRVVMVGKLPILHGHEYQSGISAPVNPARGAFLRLTHTVLVGHSHQSSDHNEKNMFDKVVSVWSTGCNCTLKPRYRPFNKWNHGCAIVNVGKGGDFEVRNLRVIEGVLR